MNEKTSDIVIVGGGLVGLTAALTLGAAAPAGAHPLGPCNDGTDDVADVAEGATGALYAKHHISALAKLGVIGQMHKPGTHMGFSSCNPSGK